MYLTPPKPDRIALDQGESPIKETPFTPRTQLSNNTTASDLLATFSPKSQPKKDPQPWISSARFPIAMTEYKRDLRNKKRVSYQVSDDSDNAPSPSVSSSSFSTPQKPRRRGTGTFIDLEEDVEPEAPKTPPPRISSAGHSLRQHQDLNLSLRAQENADKPTIKRRRRSRKQSKKILLTNGGDGEATSQKTARNEIRDIIATETAPKRANFLVAKKEYFLPLLPENNHISRLVEERNQPGEIEDLSIAYEAIQHQPQGYIMLDKV